MELQYSKRKVRPLSRQLLRQIFTWYAVLVAVVTVVQLTVEYFSIRRSNAADFLAIEKSFAPGLQQALWNFDPPMMESLVKGIAQDAMVSGITVTDKDGHVQAFSGTVPDQATVARTGFWNSTQVHRIPLQSLSSKEPDSLIGEVRLYTNASVITAKLQNSMVTIIVNALVVGAGCG